MTAEQEYLIALLRAGLYGMPPSLPEKPLDWPALYRQAQGHGVAVLAYYGLSLLPAAFPHQPGEEILAAWKKRVMRFAMEDVRKEYAMEQILAAFEADGIDCMPLKGYEMRKLYPKTEMRFMSDFDLLVDQKKLAPSRQIMKNLGFSVYRYDSHHDIFHHKDTGVNVELHRMLIVGPLEKYFGVGFERAALKKSRQHIYELSKEDYYIYILGHMAYHFAHGGIGVRSVLDVRVFLDRFGEKLDRAYLEEELQKCGLASFARRMEQLAGAWLSGGENSEFLGRFGSYIMDAQMLGTAENSRLLDAVKEFDGGDIGAAKRRALRRMIFPARKTMEFLYPKVKRHPALLPFSYPFRWAQVVFFRRKNLSRLSQTAGADQMKIRQLKEMYHELGVDHL